MLDWDVVISFLLALGTTVGWPTVVRLVIEIIRFAREKWGQQSAPPPPSSFVICIQLEKTIARRGAHNIVGLAVIVPARPIVRSRRGAMLDLDVGMSFLLALGAMVGWPAVVRIVFEVIRFVREKWFQRPVPPSTVVILIQPAKTIADGGAHTKGAENKRRKSRRRRRFRP